MNIREILEKSIKSALFSLNIDSAVKINLEHPEDLSHGDYSSNIAMVLAKVVSQNPKELAEKIVAKIIENKPNEVLKIEVAGPGFINFFLVPEFFVAETDTILRAAEKFGQNKNLKKQKTVIEFTDPNPFKEFHIGHLMSNSIGESIARVTEANGARVLRACYQGDVGLHVAKTIWAMLKNPIPNTKDQVEKAKYLGEMYAEGAAQYEIEKSEIEAINKKIYERSDRKINKLYDWGRAVSLDYFESIYKILGTKFDNYFFESKTGKFGKEIVEKNIGKVFEKSEGAVIFKGENYGLHTRVFINKEGLPTYEAKELGLSKLKFKKTGYEKSIIVTGNEINEYFKVLLKAMSLIFPELAAKTTHISHGMLRLPEGKMSSRTGKVITAISLLKEIEQKILEKMADREMTDIEKKETAEKIAVGAIKYSILKQVNGKDIIFDFDKSLSFEGDSGPYLQYSFARAKSILRKAKEEKVRAGIKKDNSEPSTLEKIMYRFPEVVERAGREYSPHYIASYLTELASSYNSFYAHGKIVDRTDLNSPYKVALTEAFSIVMKNGLNLLGIAVPEKM
jgi:arginyl-tRNA synthetase